MKTINRILTLFMVLSILFCSVATLTTFAANDNQSDSESEIEELQPLMANTCGELPINDIILGWTAHGRQSAYSHNGHGVSNDAILQAVTITPVWNSANQSWNYYGANATVCLNTSGQVTTCWATSSEGYRY